MQPNRWTGEQIIDANSSTARLKCREGLLRGGVLNRESGTAALLKTSKRAQDVRSSSVGDVSGELVGGDYGVIDQGAKWAVRETSNWILRRLRRVTRDPQRCRSARGP